MRVKAQDHGLPVPGFVHVLNDDRIREFCARVPPPWFLKPRHQAGAIGIRKISTEDELWAASKRSATPARTILLEPSSLATSFTSTRSSLSARSSWRSRARYGTPPFDVSHSGGVFTTRLLDPGGARATEVLALHERRACSSSVSCAACRTPSSSAAADGRFYFLETAARVGGAHIAELVEAAAGFNLWPEWAKIEVAGAKSPYAPPTPRRDHAGLLVSLARQSSPDLSAYCRPRRSSGGWRSPTTPV